MSFLDRGLIRTQADRDPNDERFWTPGPTYMSSSGMLVSPLLALQVSCVFQGVRLISETMGSTPLILYRELDDGGKERAKDDPMWPVLREKPNAWQTAQDWRETMTAHALLWPQGGVSEIVITQDGGLALEPLDPDTVTVEQIRTRGARRLRFNIQEPGEAPRTLVQDQVVRVRGFGVHRFFGADLLKLSREAVGLWLAMEKFGSLYFAQGTNPSIFLEHPQKLSPTAEDNLRRSVQGKYGGVHNMHKVFVLEEGMKANAVGRSARDSQMTEAKEGHVREIARWLNLPVHMLMSGDQPTFASLQEFARQLVDYTMRPWYTRWEGTLRRDLLSPDIYAEHLLDGLLRGNTLERAQAYAQFIQNGVMSENEVRARENLNPVPGLDEPRRSVNQDRGADPRQDAASPPQKKQKKKRKEADSGADARLPERLRLLAESAAQRVVRKEVAAVSANAAKLAGKPEAWSAWLDEFYAEHAALVMETLQIPPALARRYTETARASIGAGLATIDPSAWEREAVASLIALATGEYLHA